MGRYKKQLIISGEKFGSLTVLHEVARTANGRLQYQVRCDCGREYVVQRGFLLKNNPRCRECASKEYHRKKCNSHIGTVINGFRIVSGYGYNSNGSYRYKCVCLKCGSTVYRTRGELTARKGKGCINCQPDYHFKIDNNIAEGILPDGTPFQIDADFIPEFSQFYWHKNYKGYIQRGNRDMPKMLLHWFVLGYESKHTEIIDHINRNKTDCRKNNLRVITAHQNAMNHSKLSTNQSGFTGVFWNKRKQRWVSYIFTAGRHVYLGYLKDKIEAAQRYNYACKLLRGEYAGELNKIPEPSDEIIRTAGSMKPIHRAPSTATAAILPAIRAVWQWLLSKDL